MIPIPDHPIGERFCRKCKLFLPLKDFFKGKKRRYECKVHSRGRPRKAPSKKQKLPSSEQASKTSPQQKAVAQVWHAAHTDCRSSFGQATVGMSQGELRDLFEALGAEASTAFRLVPIDPCKELTTGNARMAALQNAAAADDDAGEVEGGPGQPVGLVRTEDSSERQRGEVVGDAEQDHVDEGVETDDEGDDDEDDDDIGQVD